MDDKDLKNVVQTLNQDLEEKINQMSQVRMIAKTMAINLSETDHFTKVCKDFLETFDAEACCLFWFRKREPAGWWLEAWANRNTNLKPAQNLIPEQDEGLLGWVKKQQKPSFLKDVNDEPVIQIWGGSMPLQVSMALVPLMIDDERDGVLVLFNPNFQFSDKNIRFQLEILSDLITTDIRNRLLYKGIKDFEEEFKDLLNNQTDLVVLSYPDGIIRDCNRLFLNSLGYDSDIIGNNLIDLIIDESEPPFDECWETLLGGSPVNDFHTALQAADGAKIGTLLNGNIRHTPDGRISIVILYFKPEDPEIGASAESPVRFATDNNLTQQVGQIDQFVTGLAQQLIHPVQNLINFMLLSGRDNNLNAGIEYLNQSITNLSAMMKQLTEAAEVSGTEFTSIDLNGLIESEVKTLAGQPLLKDKIRWNLEYDRSIPLIRARWKDISKVLLNIVYNAIDAVFESGEHEISISSKYDNERELIFISIRDSGTGIAEDIRHRIFEPFFTTKSLGGGIASQVSSGSGLGMADTEKILKAYGGSISFDSDVGVGTTFHIVFPIKKAE